MLLFIFLLWLPAIASAWEADLPLITLPRVPAKLGSTVELRCSKVVVDGENYDPCYPNYYNSYDCGFRWSFDDEILSNNNSRVSINSFMSSGFCATTSGTEEIANELSLKYGPGYTYESSSYSKRPGNATLYCYNSVLTISNVESDDLGTYSCNYTDHSGNMFANRYNSYSKSQYNLQNTTLYNEEMEDTGSNETLVYFGPSTIFYEPSTLIAQCTISGGPVTWKARIVNDDCPVNRISNFFTTYLSSCESETWVDLADLTSQDDYLCFKYSVKSTNQTTFGTSIIVFEDVCCYKELTVVLYCLTSDYTAGTGETSRGLVIDGSYGRNKQYYRWFTWTYRGDGLAGPCIGIPILIFLLLITVIVFAAIRGRCCSRGPRQPLFATPLVQFQQQVVPINAPGPPAYHS